MVQQHDARNLHWDLRLEHDGVLVSWALPRGIPEHPDENRLAVHTEDHPLEYLDFDGEIPKGEYGAGTMEVWDSGTYEAEKFRDDEVIATFHGERMQGRYALFATRGKDWLIHRMDPPADPSYEPMPDRLAPMLARSGELPRDEEKWGFEVKWDGIRTVAFLDHGHISLQGRNFTDFTPRYPEVRPLARELGARRVILDGEIVAFDAEGRPSFERLQTRMHLASDSAVKRRVRDTPVDLRRLRPALPRRPLDVHAHLRAAARAAGGARARGTRVARAGLPPRRGQGAARRHARAGHRGHRREAARLDLRARAGAAPRLAEDQERLRAGRGDRRLDARRGRAQLHARRAGRGRHTTTASCPTPARSAPGFTEQTLALLQRELEPLRTRHVPVRGPPAAQGHGVRRAAAGRARGAARMDSQRNDESALFQGSKR